MELTNFKHNVNFPYDALGLSSFVMVTSNFTFENYDCALTLYV